MNMNILAIDSSTPELKLILVTAKESFSQRVSPSLKHSESALPLIETLLRDAAITLNDLTQVVVGVGPGMFTGVRIAITMAQGFSYALQIPLYGVSSLKWFAAGFPHPIWVVQDARKSEFYAALFEPSDKGIMEIEETQCLSEALLKEKILASGVLDVTGTGLPLVTAWGEIKQHPIVEDFRIATWIKTWVSQELPSEPSLVEPIYLRAAVT